MSDECVSFIRKGGREAVIGYKPQVVRSGEGFITSFELDQGNPADAARAVPLVQQHRSTTGIVPASVSMDDGYSSASNMKNLKEMGVKIVSMNGAKGKKITPEKDWNSEEYQEERNGRSAVESIIYVLRNKFHLRRFSRRGHDRVTAELTEKVIAHNFWRIAYLRRKEKIPMAA